VHLYYNAQQPVIKLNEINNTVLLCWMQCYSNLDRGVLAAQLPTHCWFRHRNPRSDSRLNSGLFRDVKQKINYRETGISPQLSVICAVTETTQFCT